MSTLRVNTIQDTAGSGSPAINGLARAWVNFNGTGTVAIRASYNVSSITDNNTGDYTVNFTSPMSDANYCSVFGAKSEGLRFVLENGDSVLRSTTQLRIYILSGSNAPVDDDVACVTIFR